MAKRTIYGRRVRFIPFLSCPEGNKLEPTLALEPWAHAFVAMSDDTPREQQPRTEDTMPTNLRAKGARLVEIYGMPSACSTQALASVVAMERRPPKAQGKLLP